MFTRLTYVTCLLAPAATVGVAGAAAVVFPVADGGNGHAYEVVVDPSLTRDDARALAAAAWHLVTITSAQEQAFVESLLLGSGAPTGSYWMGMERAGGTDQFRWVTDEPFEYNNFPGGEPNNFLGVEDAGQIYWSQDPADNFAGRRGTWNDAPVAGYAEGNIADLIRVGLILEREATDDSGGEPPLPVPIPLPPALLAAPLAAGAGALALRRRRRQPV